MRWKSSLAHKVLLSQHVLNFPLGYVWLRKESGKLKVKEKKR